MQLESSVTLFDDEKVESKFAELIVDADGIRTEVSKKVGNNEVISRIRQSAESVKIQASKIEIDGVINAINNNTSTTINGGKITTGTLSASAVNASSGTFNSANIPNLSADKITSGYLSAGRIKAGSISVQKIDATSGTFSSANIPNLSASKITTGTININCIPSAARNDTYITDIGSDGIKIHDAVTNANRIEITSGGMDVIRNNDSVAKFGSSIRLGDSDGQRIVMNSSAIWLYDSDGNKKQAIDTNGIHIYSHINGTSERVAYFGDSISLYKPGTETATVYLSTSRVTIGGFDIISASGGGDYFVSDWTASGVDYRTWIRSATDSNKGETWAFSAQTKKTSESGYYGRFYAKSNGELYSGPVKANGDFSGISLEVSKSSIHLETENTMFEMLPAGIKIFFGKTATSQPNIRWSPDNFYLYYTSWTASSEQIKTAIEPVTSSKLDPRNLYNVDIVQFRYKDGIIDKEDQRFGQDLIGFVIEDLNEKYPVAVDKEIMDDPKTWSWNNAYLIPPMLKLIQDQKAQIDELKFRMHTIEEEINGQRQIN